MVTVLRTLQRTGLVEEMPALYSYRLRCEARPAFHKALADQMARFAENAPATNSVTDHIEFVRHYEGAKL